MSFNEINAVEFILTPWPLSQVERGVQRLGNRSETTHSIFSSPLGEAGEG